MAFAAFACNPCRIAPPATACGTLVAVDGVGVQDFQCGPQKPAKIKVEYRLAEGGQNLEGLVTGIYFWP